MHERVKEFLNKRKSHKTNSFYPDQTKNLKTKFLYKLYVAKLVTLFLNMFVIDFKRVIYLLSKLKI